MSAPTLQQRYQRVSLTLGIMSGILVCSIYLMRIFPMQQIDDLMTKCFFLLRGELPAPDDILIVAIDNESIRQLGRFPWRRSVHANLLKQLRMSKAIVIDILFVEPDSEHPEDDAALADAIAKCNNVILPMLRLDEPHEPSMKEEMKSLEIAFCKFSHGMHFDIASPFAKHIAAIASQAHAYFRAPIRLFTANCAGVGIAHSYPDSTNIYRHLPLGVPVSCPTDGSLRALPSVAIEATRLALGLDRDEIKFTKGGVILKDRFVATHGADWLTDINFVGGRGSFHQLPYHLVLSGKLSMNEFRGKVVIVGFTAEGLYDIRPSPFSQSTYGCEILANAIYTLIHRQHFLRLPDGIIILLALAISVLLSWSLPRINPLLSLLLVIALLSAMTLASLKLFSANILINTSPLYAGALLSYLASASWGYLTIGREHKRIKDLFALYVSKEVAEQLARYPELSAIGGDEREISVLFADIRDFTATMQRLGAKRLTKLLTEYFTAISDVIKRHGGFVDKFIGDEVMALFGAPMPTDEHAINAVMAALEMRAMVEALSRKWQERGDPPLKIGIGIATGIASVGNFGAEDRFQYTAFGDTVNLSSRLQAMTKETGATILVSSQTAKAVEGIVDLKSVGNLFVRGFSEPVEVFEVVGIKPKATATSTSK